MTYHPQPNPTMEEEEDDGPTCPLCLEELDATDRAVEACHCGYQVCLWCLHHIREQLNSRCPACRTPYQEQNFKYAEVNHEEAAKEAKERATAKKERERREKIREIEKERARAAAVSQQKAKNNLKHARILQKNLVYVIGLSLTLAREDIIRRVDMFGKFGRLTRILVNRSHPFNTDAPGGPSISAYVQYVRDSDASAAVRAMNNAVLDGREIRCAIATTKYCDAYVRSAAAADPNAAHFCGNANCMYYHSLAPEVTLTREEVLARQLGPPPPAHLFLPADTRRMHPSMRMPHSSPVPSGRPIPSRPVINAAPNMVPGSSASAIHPPPGPLLNSSAPIINPPVLSVPNPFSSPLPSPRHHQSYIARKPATAASPHRTPPSSPPERRALVSNVNRSPRVHTTSTRGPSNSFATASYAQAPPSAATRVSSNGWDASNVGHGISRSQPISGASVSVDDSSRSRMRGPLPAIRENAPPGFVEPASPRPLPSAVSRPPGFDGPSINRTTIGSKPDSMIRRENGKQLSSSIAPPPGFGPGPALKKDAVQETPNDVAAAWSQEASADQVFQAKERRAKGGTVGRVGTRSTQATQDDPNARSELAQVLAKIGGDLGVSSEFHDVTTSSSFPAIGRKPQSSPDGLSVSVSTDRPPMKPGPLDSLFGNQLGNSRFATSQPLPSLPSPSVDRINPYSSPQPFNATFPSPRARGPCTNNSEQSSAHRRSNSRFGFAREDSPEKPSATASRPLVSLPVSTSSPTRRANEGHGNEKGQSGSFHMNGSSVVDNLSSLMRSSNEISQAQVAKPLQSSGRQTRSRFDFADHRSSPPKAPSTLQSDQRTTNGPSQTGIHPVQASPTSGAKPLVNDAFIVSFAQLSTEEKLASLFNSAQWSGDQLPPMPHIDTAVDSGFQANTSRTPRAVDTAGTDETDFGSLRNRHHTAQRDTERVPLTTGSGTVQFTPPGFKEATPGNTPESSVVDNKSTSSGVARTVASGGVSSTTKGTKDNTIANNGNETTTSTAASLEDERKRSRAQRKRDKKARQQQETAERKSAAQDSASKSTQALNVPQRVPLTRPAQIPQHAQRHAGQTVIPIQSPGSDPSIERVSVVPTQAVNEDVAAVAKEQSAVLQSQDRLHTGRDPMQEANIPIPNLSHNNAPLVVLPPKANDENDKFMSVSELEKEIEAARAREAQLQDKLHELQRRIRSYDNVRT